MKLPCELSLDTGGANNDYTGWTVVALEDGGEEALAMAYSKDAEQKNLFDTPTNGYILIPNADADGNTAGMRWHLDEKNGRLYYERLFDQWEPKPTPWYQKSFICRSLL